MNEEWRVVPSFPFYAVSNLGNVKRIVAGRYKVNGKLLGAKTNRNGYRQVSLFSEGKSKAIGVHVLVCEVFNGPKPTEGIYFCCHNDGVKSNNFYKNLRWATPKENSADKEIHGTKLFGDKHPNRINKNRMARGEKNGGGGKLKEEQVRQIFKDPRIHRVIANDYGVVKSMVSMIKRREVWRHATENMEI